MGIFRFIFPNTIFAAKILFQIFADRNGIFAAAVTVAVKQLKEIAEYCGGFGTVEFFHDQQEFFRVLFFFPVFLIFRRGFCRRCIFFIFVLRFCFFRFFRFQSLFQKPEQGTGDKFIRNFIFTFTFTFIFVFTFNHTRFVGADKLLIGVSGIECHPFLISNFFRIFIQRIAFARTRRTEIDDLTGGIAFFVLIFVAVITHLFFSILRIVFISPFNTFNPHNIIPIFVIFVFEVFEVS